jgi:hypothetical protein
MCEVKLHNDRENIIIIVIDVVCSRSILNMRLRFACAENTEKQT